jgi:hypothetical protein
MKHKIILLNFSKQDTRIVANAGYNVENGFIGTPNPATKYFPFYSPHPLYEYDILFYNSYISPEVAQEIGKTPQNLYDQPGSHEALQTLKTPPYVRISFIGVPSGANLIQGGTSFVKLIKAEQNVSSLVTPKGSIYTIEKLHALLTRYNSEVKSVGQFFAFPKDIYPLIHIPVLLSRSGENVAGYGITYQGEDILRYIILPQFKDIPKSVVEILECIEDITPKLFPDKVKRNWLETDEYLLPEERRIQKEIQDKISEATKFIDEKKRKKEEIAKKNAFVRGLLTATEDNKDDPEMRLSVVVKKALEYLEFKVEDIDQKTKSIIKKEDFWVIDGDYFAITEVSGTVNKNPKVKEFNDILARVATIYKRKGDLVLPQGVTVCGLLILNYDIDNHPSKRPKLYKGEDEHIAETAVEQCIGLLSTVEFHKIIAAVMEGRISKKDARKIVRIFGRIEFDTNKSVT